MSLVLINNYETFLNSTEVLNPPEVNEISEQINDEQQEMLNERDAHFQSLKTLTVEKASKQQTYDWFQVKLQYLKKCTTGVLGCSWCSKSNRDIV